MLLENRINLLTHLLVGTKEKPSRRVTDLSIDTNEDITIMEQEHL